MGEFFKRIQEQELASFNVSLQNPQLKDLLKDERSIKTQELERLLDQKNSILVNRKVDLQDQIKVAISQNSNFKHDKHVEKVTSFCFIITNAIQRDIQFNDKRSIKKLLTFLSSYPNIEEVIQSFLNMKKNIAMLFNEIEAFK